MNRYAVFICVAFAVGCSRPAEPDQATSAPTANVATATSVAGRAAAGALVSLEPEGGAPMPQGNAVMDQFSKAFVPETLFVRVGQPVVFKNSEDQLHNVTVVRTRTGRNIFNVSQNQGDVHTHTFDQAGEYDVTCDVHPGMRGMVVATTTPYAVYADAAGVFAFQSIPPGKYKLRVAAQGQEFTRDVDVAGAQLDLGTVR
jgi:plastocyanin